MSAGSLLPVAVVLPIIGAVASPLLGKLNRRLPLLIGLPLVAGSAGILINAASPVYSGGGSVVVHFLSAEKPVKGAALGIALAADPFGLTFALLTAVLGFLLMLALLSEFGHLGERELGGLACLTQLMLAAFIGFAMSGDTINMFVWFQVAALSSYGLTGFFLERPIALEAAFKLLVLTGVAGFAVFIGSAMLYSNDGALNLAQLHNALHRSSSPPITLVALALLLVGYGTKAGIAPFHTWLPDAHTPVPGGISALFSGLMVNLGIVGMTRLVLQVYGPNPGHHMLGLLTGLGLCSALLGAVMALVQDDLKRLLAWDTVSQMGILLVGFATARPDGVTGATLHLVNHALFKALLFLCAGSVVHSTGLTKLSELGGLIRYRRPVTIAFTVGALAISGIPGFNGYVSLSLLHEGIADHPVLLYLALLAQVITIGALGRALWLGFYRPRPEPYEHIEPTSAGLRVSLAVLGVGCVGFGVVAYWLVHHIGEPAAAGLLDPARYASAVLSGGGGRLHPASVDFSYGKLEDLLRTAVEVVLGVALAWWRVKRAEPRAVTWLRRLHTGSVNDYAAMLAAGLVVVSAFVLL